MFNLLRNKSNGVVAAADGQPNGGGPLRGRTTHEATDHQTDTDQQHVDSTTDSNAVIQGGMILRRCVVVQEQAMVLDDDWFLS